MSVTMKNTELMLTERGLQPMQRVQTALDQKVVLNCDKYVPMRSGTLKKAIGTVYGSGKVQYNTPYARPNYYSNMGRGVSGTANGGFRGRLWFSRAKDRFKAAWLNLVRGLAGAKRR